MLPTNCSMGTLAVEAETPALVTAAVMLCTAAEPYLDPAAITLA